MQTSEVNVPDRPADREGCSWPGESWCWSGEGCFGLVEGYNIYQERCPGPGRERYIIGKEMAVIGQERAGMG